MNITVVRAFMDELEKVGVAGRSIASDFMAGVDPTGTKTFQYGMDDQARGGASGVRRAVGTAGGVLGGAVAIPAATGGIVGAAKGFATGSGGIKSRLLSAAKGALWGAKKPFSMLYHGSRGLRGVTSAQAGRAMTGGEAQSLRRLVSESAPAGMVKIPKTPTGARATEYVRGLGGARTEALRKHLVGETATGAGLLGASGVIGGGSAYLQYGKGADTQKRLGARPRRRSINV